MRIWRRRRWSPPCLCSVRSSRFSARCMRIARQLGRDRAAYPNRSCLRLRGGVSGVAQYDVGSRSIPHWRRIRGTCMVGKLSATEEEGERTESDRLRRGCQKEKRRNGWMSPSHTTSHWRCKQNGHRTRCPLPGGGDGGGSGGDFLARPGPCAAGVQHDRRRALQLDHIPSRL